MMETERDWNSSVELHQVSQTGDRNVLACSCFLYVLFGKDWQYVRIGVRIYSTALSEWIQGCGVTHGVGHRERNDAWKLLPGVLTGKSFSEGAAVQWQQALCLKMSGKGNWSRPFSFLLSDNELFLCRKGEEPAVAYHCYWIKG